MIAILLGLDLVVFAASSLREAFIETAALFEREHAGAKVALDFAGSQELRAQIESGAVADLFASADQWQLETLARRGLVEKPVVFARNELVIVTPPDDPAGISTLDDLPRAARIVLGATAVPVGAYSERLLQAHGAAFRAQVEARIVSRELNVRQVLTKVALGEADAAIVYRTDALAGAGRVRTVAIPSAQQPELAEYPIAVLRDAPHAALARAFVALVLSPRGRAILERRGFLAAAVADSAKARVAPSAAVPPRQPVVPHGAESAPPAKLPRAAPSATAHPP